MFCVLWICVCKFLLQFCVLFICFLLCVRFHAVRWKYDSTKTVYKTNVLFCLTAMIWAQFSHSSALLRKKWCFSFENRCDLAAHVLIKQLKCKVLNYAFKIDKQSSSFNIYSQRLYRSKHKHTVVKWRRKYTGEKMYTAIFCKNSGNTILISISETHTLYILYMHV